MPVGASHGRPGGRAVEGHNRLTSVGRGLPFALMRSGPLLRRLALVAICIVAGGCAPRHSVVSTGPDGLRANEPDDPADPAPRSHARAGPDALTDPRVRQTITSEMRGNEFDGLDDAEGSSVVPVGPV